MSIDEQALLRDKIIEATTEVFNEKGVKFKMEDVAKALAISKKTIYTVFSDKESLLTTMVHEGFAKIKRDEAQILQDPQRTTLDKIRQVIIALPDSLKRVDYKQFHEVATKYPKLFKTIQQHIEGEWDPTLKLLEQGMAEGVIRPVNTTVLKLMIEASIEHFLESDGLQSQGIAYTDALESMMDILIEGMKVRKPCENVGP